MNQKAPAELKVIPELDGVRGIAILLVLGFHFGHMLPFPGNKVFALGWAGVDLFFVLSGFLITRILWTTRQNQNYFVSFYGRRILRIFPLAFAFLAAYFWIALPLAHHYAYDLDRNGSDQLWYWAYLANWHHGIHGSLIHLWSLSVEEQFYLVWPAIIFAVSRTNLRRLCLLLVILPLSLRCLFVLAFHMPINVNQTTVCRTEALALGALIAVCDDLDDLRSLAVPAAVGVLVVAILNGAEGRVMGIYGLTLVALACAGFVQLAIKRAGSSSKFSVVLRSAWLRRFGKYSYAIYVLHGPFVAATFHLPARAQTPLREITLFFACIMSSYAAGWLSWQLLESRILRLKRHFNYDNKPRTEPARAAAGSTW